MPAPKTGFSHVTVHCLRLLAFLVFAFVYQTEAAEKIRYAIDTECDRYSLDAVYHEKFKPITVGVFDKQLSFVNKVADLVADSLTSVMADLPDRDVSSNEEKKIFSQFKVVKSMFKGKLKRIERNITSTWDTLVTMHFDLMYDNGKTSLQEYLNKTLNLTDTYVHGKETLDSHVGSFVAFIKATIRDGLDGINAGAHEALRHEGGKRKKKETEEESDENENNSTKNAKDDEDEIDINTEEGKEEFLQKKRLEIVKMVVPGFLGKITTEVIVKKLDLHQKVNYTYDQRESPLDDAVFDVLMIGNRIQAIVQPDMPTDKGSVDLARRSIYTYWADMANTMYKERLENAKKSAKDDNYDDETELVEILLDLMETYP